MYHNALSCVNKAGYIACACIAVVLPGMASELVIREIGIRGEALPTEIAYEVSSSSGLARSGTDYLAVNLGVAVWGKYSLALPGQPWGIVVGGDLALADGRNIGSDLMGLETRLAVGLGGATSKNTTVLIEMEYGYGIGRSRVKTIGLTSSGTMRSVTPQISLWWRCLERGQLTMTAGWRRSEGKFSGDGLDIDLKQNGLFLAVGICWSASRAPWSLE